MNQIQFVQLTCDNVNENSLDDYVRDQVSQACWRLIDGVYKLVPCDYRFTWDIDKRRSNAKEILDVIRAGDAAFGAFDGDKLIGYALLSLSRFGSCRQYAQLKMLQVSAPYRSLGIGRKLFAMAADTARALNIPKLYISANSTKESQAAYRRMGCVYAEEVEPALAALEPHDVQMEFKL